MNCNVRNKIIWHVNLDGHIHTDSEYRTCEQIEREQLDKIISLGKKLEDEL